MREEIADLAARGCTYLQMDEVPLAVLCDPKNRDIVKGRGENPEELIDTYIDAINASIKDRPPGMSVCVHFCRGNRDNGMADGGYEPIADRIFNRLNVDGFFLEYDTPRAGDFTPLRFVPKGKKVVLGLVTSKRPQMEDKDALKRRTQTQQRLALRQPDARGLRTVFNGLHRIDTPAFLNVGCQLDGEARACLDGLARRHLHLVDRAEQFHQLGVRFAQDAHAAEIADVTLIVAA